MNDPQFSGTEPPDAPAEDASSALFAQLILQQANLAMMLLGQSPHPQSGETARDLEGAKMFIDQLAMLEVKTKGNLSKEEERLLRQSLMSLRMAFVEAVESPAPAPPSAGQATPAARADSGPGAPGSQLASEPSVPDAESKRKFSKKY